MISPRAESASLFGAFLLGFWLCGAAPEPVAAEEPRAKSDNYKYLYNRGLRSFDFERYREAANYFLRAVERRPESGGERIPGPGTRLRPYLPYYYLGRTQFELGRYDRALDYWEMSERQGQIGPKNNKKAFRRVEALRAEIAGTLLPAQRRAIERRLELAASELASRRRIRDEFPPDALRRRLDSQIDRIADRLTLARGDAAQGQLTAAAQSLEATFQALLDFDTLAEEHRAAREYREAVAVVQRVECNPDVIETLQRLAARDRPVWTDPPSTATPLLLLGRATLACGDLVGAGVFLEQAQQREPVSSDAIAALRYAIDRTGFFRAYASVESALEDGICRSAIIDELSELRRSNVMTRVAQKEEVSLELALAEAYLLCGDLDRASELAAAAATSPGQQEKRQSLEARVQDARNRRDRERLYLDLQSSYDALAETIVRPGCDRASIEELENLLKRGWDRGRAEGRLDGTPYLLLGRATIDCEDAERAKSLHALAERYGEGSREELDALRDRIEQLVMEKVTRDRRRKVVVDYIAADARIRLGECSENAIAAVERAIEVLGTGGTKGISLVEGVVYNPLLTLAWGHRACGDRESAREHLAAATTIEASPDIELRALQSWLRGLPYTSSYALVVGVSDYDHNDAWEDLPGVAKDVVQIKSLLEAHDVQVELLLDPEQTELISRMSRFFRQTRGRDRDARVLFFFAGHGYTDTNSRGEQLGYIVPRDTTRVDEDKYTHLEKMIGMEFFQEYAKMDARHAVFIFDSCFSGTVFDATGARFEAGQRNQADLESLLDRDVRLILTAGAATQEVPDVSKFKTALVTALEGQGDMNRDGVILGSELGEYVTKNGVSRTAKGRVVPQWGWLRTGREESQPGDVLFLAPRQVAAPEAIREVENQVRHWRRIEESDDPRDIRQYLASYPRGLFAALARGLLEEAAGADAGLASGERARAPVDPR